MDHLKVLVAENDTIFKGQIQEAFLVYSPMAKFYFAHSSTEVLEVLSQEKIDILFIDVLIKGLGGIETTRKIRGITSTLKILATTTEDDRSLIMRLIRAGVNGYVLKFIKKAQLVNAIESVLDDRFYFSDNTAANQKYHGSGYGTNLTSQENHSVPLTSIEIKIMLLICEQHSLPDIMNETGLDEATINSYVAGMFKKTGTGNLIGLALYAVRNGYIKTDQMK